MRDLDGPPRTCWRWRERVDGDPAEVFSDYVTRYVMLPKG
jgi:hypothetical protein